MQVNMFTGTQKIMSDQVNSQKLNGTFFFDWDGPEEYTDVPESEGVSFVPVDLASVAPLRDYIETKIRKIGLRDDHAFELTLISDELVANAIAATFENGVSDAIVYRWRMYSDRILISVLDYGGGFQLSNVFKEIPTGDTLPEFLSSLRRYRKKNRGMVRSGGQVIEHNRFGRGLRIVTGLADAVYILYHSKDGSMTRNPVNETLGTVVSVRYNLDREPMREASIN